MKYEYPGLNELTFKPYPYLSDRDGLISVESWTNLTMGTNYAIALLGEWGYPPYGIVDCRLGDLVAGVDGNYTYKTYPEVISQLELLVEY